MHALIRNGVLEQYPYSGVKLRNDNPTTSFPSSMSDSLLAEWGVYRVNPTDRPGVDLTKTVTEGTPVLQDGKWVQTWVITDASPEEISERTRTMREGLTQQNNDAYEQALAQMTVDYPASEIATWERQRAEVIAWQADNTAATPWIDLAASARGLDRTEYLTRTLAKVQAFTQASAWLTGRRQGIDDAIRAATLEELQAITIDYSLPGSSV